MANHERKLSDEQMRVREEIQEWLLPGYIDGITGLLQKRGFTQRTIHEAIILGGEPEDVGSFLEKAIEEEAKYARTISGNIRQPQDQSPQIGGVSSQVYHELLALRQSFSQGDMQPLQDYFQGRFNETKERLTDFLMIMPESSLQNDQLSEQGREVIRTFRQYTLFDALFVQVTPSLQL